MLDSVKAKKLMTVFTAVLVANFVVPVFASAESLDSLNEKESAITQQSDKISAEVQLALNDVNDKYAEVEATKTEIAKNEVALTDAQEEIKVTEQNIEKRKTAAAQRLKDIQVNGGAERDWTALLDSSNLQELINRAYAMSVLQNAEKEKITSLTSEKEKLETLKDKVENTQETLKENEASLEADAKELDDKIANLQEQLAENKNILQEIANSKEAEESRLAAEKAAAEKAAEKAEQEKAAAEKAAAEKTAQKESSASSTSEPSSSSTSASSETSTSETEENSSNNNSSNNTGSTTGGKTMMMESTAYSYAEAGASYFTASGTDLRKNPQAVAVDPSVIPLGTVVEVQGYGVALALDTGGAIKGNIIDVHFPTVDQCTSWGRRQVKVTIRG